MPVADPPPLRSFGRLKARSLKPAQAKRVEILLPRLAVDLAAPVLVERLFEGASFHVLEIGFGSGEHLVAQAKAHPEWGVIGVEPFQNGMGSCLRQIEEARLTNVRLHMGDARDVVARLEPSQLDLVYILFPDPWPKARHWKRRLIQPPFIAELARVLKPGAEVRFATDWAHYASWTLEAFSRHPDFVWTAQTASDWRSPFAGHSPTRYEQKRLGDCAPVWLRFRREFAKER